MSEIKDNCEKNNNSSDQNRYLQFDLGEESYAIPLLKVKEVIPVPETTPLPNSSSYYVGIMNLRGQIISIVDLKKKLKIDTEKEKKEEAVVIVEINNVGIGLIVDSINKVLNLNGDDISEVPEIKSQVNGQYIQGVHKSDDKLTIFLDLEKVLNIEEIKNNRAAA